MFPLLTNGASVNVGLVGFRNLVSERRTDAHGVDDRQYLMVKKWKSS
jgi:hypothetical protein